MENSYETVKALEDRIESIRLALKTLSREVDSIERNLKYIALANVQQLPPLETE